MDIALFFNPERFDFDLTLAGQPGEVDLEGDDGLLTAIIISLFTDRRANPDDPLPDERVGVSSDLRGYWGDTIAEIDRQNPLGSRLWLLSREKEMPVVVARAQQYAEEAVQWIVREGLAQEVRVQASHAGPAYLGIAVQALPPVGVGGPVQEWTFIFDYQNAAPVSIQAPGM